MTVGQQYLTSLRESASRQRERQSKARALSVQMHRMFLPLAEEITCKRMDSGKMLLDIAHLIDNKTIERYQNKYTSATQELKECSMQLSGPWPPYHFVHRSTHNSSTTHKKTCPRSPLPIDSFSPAKGSAPLRAPTHRGAPCPDSRTWECTPSPSCCLCLSSHQPRTIGCPIHRAFAMGGSVYTPRARSLHLLPPRIHRTP